MEDTVGGVKVAGDIAPILRARRSFFLRFGPYAPEKLGGQKHRQSGRRCLQR